MAMVSVASNVALLRDGDGFCRVEHCRTLERLPVYQLLRLTAPTGKALRRVECSGRFAARVNSMFIMKRGKSGPGIFPRSARRSINGLPFHTVANNTASSLTLQRLENCQSCVTYHQRASESVQLSRHRSLPLFLLQPWFCPSNPGNGTLTSTKLGGQ